MKAIVVSCEETASLLVKQLKLIRLFEACTGRVLGKILTDHRERGRRGIFFFPGLGLQIIHVNLTSENPQPLRGGSTLEFTYSVTWQSTDIPFSKRFDRYLDYNFFEHQVGGWMGGWVGGGGSTAAWGASILC